MAITNTISESIISRPVFYRLPRPQRPVMRGKGKARRIVGWLPAEHDQYFGFSRAFYYEAERRGWLKLVRIREPGKPRGVTLIPYQVVAAFVRAQAEAQGVKEAVS